MNKKYALVRSTKKGNWKACCLPHTNNSIIGETTSDRAAVERDRDMMAYTHREYKYAVLEVTEG